MSHGSSRTPRRSSRSRDRWRRRSPDTSRRPFSVFPSSTEERPKPAFKLTPNDSTLRQDHEQDLHSWRNLDHRDNGRHLPPLVRRISNNQQEAVPPISLISHPDGRMQNDMHSAPPPEDRPFFLDAMRIVAQPHQPTSSTTAPINLQIYPTSRHQLQDIPPATTPAVQSLPSTSTIPVQPTTERRTSIPYTTSLYDQEINHGL